MKKITALFILIFIMMQGNAQCTSGNCITGTGTYNFGWCIYTGEFKNGKPEGTGTMKYDDYSYTGTFKNGLENGKGIITNKDGSKENVAYNNGIKYIVPIIKMAPGEYKPIQPQDVNCISGDCINGVGTYRFPSGNKYVGNFKDYKREGQGTFYFQNGDQFTGSWANNTEKEGTYTFATGGQYQGTYDGNGNELNGKILVAGQVIPFENGKAILPPPPEVSTTYNNSSGVKQPSTERVKKVCPLCHGSKQTHYTIPGGSYKFDQYGNKETIWGKYTSCILCGGTGYQN